MGSKNKTLKNKIINFVQWIGGGGIVLSGIIYVGTQINNLWVKIDTLEKPFSDIVSILVLIVSLSLPYRFYRLAVRRVRTTELLIFISHSSEDVKFVEALIELIRAALSINPDRIRCTGVQGYKLKTGIKTDETLREEVNDARLLMGVITPSSMKSAYVLFELGARWIIDKPMFPIIACGANSSILKGPLININAIECYKSADIHQIIGDIATELKIEKANAASYQVKIERLVELSKKENKIRLI